MLASSIADLTWLQQRESKLGLGSPVVPAPSQHLGPQLRAVEDSPPCAWIKVLIIRATHNSVPYLRNGHLRKVGEWTRVMPCWASTHKGAGPAGGPDPGCRGPYLGSDPAWSRPAQTTDPPCPGALQRSSKAICYLQSSYHTHWGGASSPQPGRRPVRGEQALNGRMLAGWWQ